jgi:hypothetical protein
MVSQYSNFLVHIKYISTDAIHKDYGLHLKHKVHAYADELAFVAKITNEVEEIIQKL